MRTQTLADAMRILAETIESDDGVANAAIAEAAEAAERLEELQAERDELAAQIERYKKRLRKYESPATDSIYRTVAQLKAAYQASVMRQRQEQREANQ